MEQPKNLTENERNDRLNELIEKRQKLKQHYDEIAKKYGDQFILDIDEIHPGDVYKLQEVLANPQRIPPELEREFGEIKLLEEEITKLAA